MTVPLPKSEGSSDDPAAGYPIAVVAARTGLSRDVLRVWERRYSAVAPMRTPGGQRLYSDEHVNRFRLLAAATRHGRSIGSVAHLDTDALARMAVEDEAALPRPDLGADASTARDVDAAMAPIIALDGASLNTLLRQAIARRGLLWFLEQLAPSLMRRVGDDWANGRLTIAHEHLATETVIAIALETIHAVPAAPSALRLVVATPTGERHAGGAAISAAVASIDGWSIVYLGPDIPDADIATAAAETHARAVALSIVYVGDHAKIVSEVRGLRAKLSDTIPLLIGGAGVAGLVGEVRGRGIVVCESVAHLRAELAVITPDEHMENSQ